MNLSDSRVAVPVPRRVSAREAVLTHLRDAIGRGDYAVGDRLPSEASLSREYQVSRSVVREALRGLQALGLTVSRTGRGTFVTADGPPENPTFGQYSAQDLVEVRRHVEVPVAGFAARRRGEDELALLTALVERMDTETREPAWVALDSQFHVAIARASGNPVFAKVIEEIRDALARQSAFLNRLGDRRAESNVEHRRILDAIADGSETAAVAAMTTHLDHVEQTLITIVWSGRTSDAETRPTA
ncbi:FadR/GntR family transcriptional regulator [Amycolatopsis jiangsuensis]|uniref:DNA-binding FadR family transcriptional regulator n=1 Tax=Amycolatopsis jiangsuensis TaxID=1181879 RepID=A0A840ITJ7_9PSEU|nr:FadR/GntR family transcriptional regulator [Amycolatopsis jiangsuensis]MBB4685190.1 DNA-binding FadR family transcriptional regulator [Amycolatopsis jiangsuensis]